MATEMYITLYYAAAAAAAATTFVLHATSLLF